METFWLYQQPIWVLPFSMLVILVLAMEVGFRLGLRTYRGTVGRGTKPARDMTLTGLLALLGLMLSFTYAYSLSRADLRKFAVFDEVNAIGTALAAAGLAPVQERAKLQRRFLDYARTRIGAYGEWRTAAGRRGIVERTLRAQAEIWPAAESAMASGVPPPLQAVIFNSVRDVMDIHTERLGVAYDRVPPFVLVTLMAVSTAALLTAAYNAGVHGKINRWRMILYGMVLTAIITLIVDFDDEEQGFIEVSIEPFETLIAGMEEKLAVTRENH